MNRNEMDTTSRVRGESTIINAGEAMEEMKVHQFKEKLKLLDYEDRTIKEYAEEVGRFYKYLEERENLQSIMNLRPEHIKAWHAFLTFEKSKRYNRLLAGGTVRHRLQAVKTFFKVMHEENLYPHDYTSCIVMPKKPKTLPKNVPGVDGIRKLLQTAVPDNPLHIRDRFMFELMYATGIRSLELRRLTIYDLHIQDRTLHIKGKGSKDRVVPIGERVIPYALEYLHAGRPWLLRLVKTDLLLPSKNGWQLDSKSLHWIVQVYKQKAGLQMKVTPHTLRHACATHMLQAGADIRYVQELLGHEDLSTTQIYTQVTIGDLKKAHLKYHPANRDDFRDEPAS